MSGGRNQIARGDKQSRGPLASHLPHPREDVSLIKYNFYYKVIIIYSSFITKEGSMVA